MLLVFLQFWILNSFDAWRSGHADSASFLRRQIRCRQKVGSHWRLNNIGIYSFDEIGFSFQTISITTVRINEVCHLNNLTIQLCLSVILQFISYFLLILQPFKSINMLKQRTIIYWPMILGHPLTLERWPDISWAPSKCKAWGSNASFSWGLPFNVGLLNLVLVLGWYDAVFYLFL